MKNKSIIEEEKSEVTGLEMMFPKATKECFEKILVRQKKYGEAWKTMEMDVLNHHFDTEIQELINAVAIGDIDETRKEFVDVINMGLMIVERMNEEKQ